MFADLGTAVMSLVLRWTGMVLLTAGARQGLVLAAKEEPAAPAAKEL